MQRIFDVIVVGGGHAGIEAAVACATMGMRTALLSMDSRTIGRLSCNPSIGGSAKGHLAKEIDALGGVMPRIADASGLQFKTLNKSKGPAVWSPRSQNDKDLYPTFAQSVVLQTIGLTVVSETATEILVSGSTVRGIRTASNEEILAKAVILCSGTFLNAVMWTGMGSTKGGRVGEESADLISDLLTSHGLTKGRLKTGTPPRVSKGSLDLSRLAVHNGDESPIPFSHRTSLVKNTLACWGSTTSEHTHEVIRDGFDRSPMFTGLIKGAGPRYCPSIEDKVARFNERPSHPIVLEPEGLYTDSVYVNGFSTSLPPDIQEKGLKTISGLKNVKIQKYGYAVEYDFFFPYQLHFTLETKAVSGLYFAGQINGTSGYEEAASQGLVAGINAALRIQGRDPFVLKRSEAYIGVMIDDLVNKNTEEPYRIFTSLAEYRLLLRVDTVYDRLFPYGRSFGLVSDASYKRFEHGGSLREMTLKHVDASKLTPACVNPMLAKLDEDPITESTCIRQIAKRPTTDLRRLLELSSFDLLSVVDEHPTIVAQTLHEIRYEGYIQKQLREVERFADNEKKLIPPNFEFNIVPSLSTEAREKLNMIKPGSLGQASRIPGVSASDISVLSLFLK